MDKIRKLRLIDYKYDEARDLIRWKVRDETSNDDIKEYVLAWPGSDLAALFGIKTKLPASVIIKFSEDMKNRSDPFYMKSESTIKSKAEDWSKDTPESTILEAHKEVDYFPFREVHEQIMEEDIETGKQIEE